MADNASNNSSDNSAPSGASELGIPLLPLPNLDSGSIDLLGALNELGVKKGAQVRATSDAVTKNLTIQKDYEAKQEQLDNETLSAFDNLTKIQKLGGDNAITRMLGFFDSSYNPKVQQLTIQANTVKAKQAADRAQTMMNINNQEPALKAAETDLAAQQFDFQMKALSSVSAITELNQKTMGLRLQKAELSLKLDEATKKNIEFRLNSMTLPQVKAELAQAQKGKGDFAQLQGFLEERIDKEEQMDLNLEQLKTAVASGDIDLQNKATRNIASHIPASISAQLLQQAQNSGQAVVTIGDGKNQVQIPTTVLAEELDKNFKVDQAVQASVIANQTSHVLTDLLDVSSTAAALSNDKRAANERGFLVAARARLDPNNPATVMNLKAAVDASKLRMKEIVKSTASTYGTAEAKAAIEQFAERGGQFDLPGAHAVSMETLGKPAVAAVSKFTNVWMGLNKALSEKIAEQNMSGAPPLDSRSAASQAALLAWAMRQGDRIKMPELKEVILSDPAFMDIAGKGIRGQLQADLINSTLGEVTKSDLPSGVFSTLAKQLNGPTTPAQIAEYLERQSVLGQRKIDYNQAFLEALQNKSTNMEDLLNDPSYTINDRALQTHIFGENSQKFIMSDFISTFAKAAQNARIKMDQAIEADKKGVPQRQAEQQAIQNMPFADFMNTETGAMITQAGKTAPSATGTEKPASYISQLYGGQ